jgi:hypothetical protein
MNQTIKKINRNSYLAIRQLIGEERTLKLLMMRNQLMFRWRNRSFHDECYITCSGKMDGAGAQSLAIMSTLLFSQAMHIKYVHTPFAKMQHNYENDPEYEKEWENFFNLGMNELNISDQDLFFPQIENLGESPLEITKKPKALFVLRHCHDFSDMFPNRYSHIREKFIAKYFSTPKEGYTLNYDPQKVNIAIHIRRGDVNGNNQFRDKFTENDFIAKVLDKIIELTSSSRKGSAVWVYSEGKIEDFKLLERENLKFCLNTDPFSTFHNLVSADVLIMSKSTFSYSAALLSRGIVIYEPFRHRRQKGWIEVNEEAGIRANLFSRKLREYLSSHHPLE